MPKILDVFLKYETDILSDWITQITKDSIVRSDLVDVNQIKSICKEFITLFRNSDLENCNIYAEGWKKTRDFLNNLSKNWAKLGFTPAEVIFFVLSLKKPLIIVLQKEAIDINIILDFTELIDRLGIFTSECYMKVKEDIIRRQQEEMMELSTPIIKLWDGILALPLIGTLDSARTQVVMEGLLNKIVETSSSIAIIDITGVPTVDTLVAQHLMKTVTAAKLMGATCIISGIRPQIAQTMIHLGVTFTDVVTKATLAEAISYAFRLFGYTVVKSNS